MNETVQIAAVVVIEALAVLYLASRIWTRRGRKPRVLTKPDVPVSSLIRKKPQR